MHKLLSALAMVALSATIASAQDVARGGSGGTGGAGDASAANQVIAHGYIDGIETLLTTLTGQTADYDTGGGTDTTVMFGIALPASGGAVPITASNPFPVTIISGAGIGGTAAADEATFTLSTTSITPMGCIEATDTMAAGVVGGVKCGSDRELDVDVMSLPALAAGDNDIGNVDLELAGTAVSVTNPVPFRLSDGSAFVTPATDATIGSSIGTSGPVQLAVYADFDGSAIPTIANVDTEGEAVPVAASIKGVQYIMITSEDGSLQYFTSTTPGVVAPAAAATGGADVFRSIDLDETEEEVKATAGTLYSMWVTNTATSTRWIKCYNATAANVTVGTTTPVITIGVPGNTSDDVSGQLGAGTAGYAFGTALSCAATTGVADNDTGAPAANDVIVNIFYK